MIIRFVLWPLKRRYVLAFFQRLPPCLVGIEACASSHHWSRELQALGHTVRSSSMIDQRGGVVPRVLRIRTTAWDRFLTDRPLKWREARAAHQIPGGAVCDAWLFQKLGRHYIEQRTEILLAALGGIGPAGPAATRFGAALAATAG